MYSRLHHHILEVNIFFVIVDFVIVDLLSGGRLTSRIIHFLHFILHLETRHLFFHELVLVKVDDSKAEEQKTGQSKP